MEGDAGTGVNRLMLAFWGRDAVNVNYAPRCFPDKEQATWSAAMRLRTRLEIWCGNLAHQLRLCWLLDAGIIVYAYGSDCGCSGRRCRDHVRRFYVRSAARVLRAGMPQTVDLPAVFACLAWLDGGNPLSLFNALYRRRSNWARLSITLNDLKDESMACKNILFGFMVEVIKNNE